MSNLSPTDKLIRKLRKKLRQIERLELLGHSSLNEEEVFKVKQKDAIRVELAHLLLDNSGEDFLSPESLPTQSESPLNLEEKDKASRALFTTPEKLPSASKNLEFSELEPVIAITPLENFSSLNIDKPFVAPILPISDATAKMKRSSPSDSSDEQLPAAVPQPAKVEEREGKRPKPGNSLSGVKANTSNKQQATAAKPWHDTSFLFNILEGHSDIVCCVDLDETYLISGSRDTLGQVWCAKTGSALTSLRGHTNTVTCVGILSAQHSNELNSAITGNFSEESGGRLALTASADCYLKLWNIENGTALRSVYTFSAVTAVCYLPSLQCCVIGSEGGKLEIYSFLEQHTNPVDSIKAFEGAVSSIKVLGENIICSSLDGHISVWFMKGTELCRLYESECLVTETGQIIYPRPCLSLATQPGSASTAFYGDEGASLKAINWKTGQVKKLRNHLHEFGLTNAICATKSFLFSSSINLDTGSSMVNVRSLPNMDYIGTFCIPGAGRIICLVATEENQSIRLAVGGTTLILLETRGIGCRRSPQKDAVIKPQFLTKMALPAGDSEEETSSSSDEEEEPSTVDEMPDDPEAPEKNGPWCVIL